MVLRETVEQIIDRERSAAPTEVQEIQPGEFSAQPEAFLIEIVQVLREK
jgi:hypothetical protein